MMTTGGAGGAVTTTSLTMVVRSVRVELLPELEVCCCGIWMTITWGGDVGAGSGAGVWTGIDEG